MDGISVQHEPIERRVSRTAIALNLFSLVAWLATWLFVFIKFFAYNPLSQSARTFWGLRLDDLLQGRLGFDTIIMLFSSLVIAGLGILMSFWIALGAKKSTQGRTHWLLLTTWPAVVVFIWGLYDLFNRT